MKHLQTKKEYGSLNCLVGGGLGRSGAAADKSPLIFGNENGVAKTFHNLSSSWRVVEPSPPMAAGWPVQHCLCVTALYSLSHPCRDVR